MKQADTTVVVLVPESGDAVQTMKAGLMEAADIFVVNKADRAGADGLVAELRFAVHLHRASPSAAIDVDWEIPVLAAEAQNSVGMVDLLSAIRRHRAALEASGALEARRAVRRRLELQALLVEALTDAVRRRVHAADLAAILERVASGDTDPYSAARTILGRPDLLTPS